MTIDGTTFFDVWNHNSSAAQLLINSQVSVI
jgi:hypothetical protein